MGILLDLNPLVFHDTSHSLTALSWHFCSPFSAVSAPLTPAQRDLQSLLVLTQHRAAEGASLLEHFQKTKAFLKFSPHHPPTHL